MKYFNYFQNYFLYLILFLIYLFLRARMLLIHLIYIFFNKEFLVNTEPRFIAYTLLFKLDHHQFKKLDFLNIKYCFIHKISIKKQI